MTKKNEPCSAPILSDLTTGQNCRFSEGLKEQKMFTNDESLCSTDKEKLKKDREKWRADFDDQNNIYMWVPIDKCKIVYRASTMEREILNA